VWGDCLEGMPCAENRGEKGTPVIED